MDCPFCGKPMEAGKLCGARGEYGNLIIKNSFVSGGHNEKCQKKDI